MPNDELTKMATENIAIAARFRMAETERLKAEAEVERLRKEMGVTSQHMMALYTTLSAVNDALIQGRFELDGTGPALRGRTWREQMTVTLEDCS